MIDRVRDLTERNGYLVRRLRAMARQPSAQDFKTLKACEQDMDDLERLMADVVDRRMAALLRLHQQQQADPPRPDVHGLTGSWGRNKRWVKLAS